MRSGSLRRCFSATAAAVVIIPLLVRTAFLTWCCAQACEEEVGYCVELSVTLRELGFLPDSIAGRY